MKIFIDTAPLIYLIEKQDSLSAAVESQLHQWLLSSEKLATSTLTLLELLVIPKKHNNQQMAHKYGALLRDLLSEPPITLSSSIAEMAAEIRGMYEFRTPDAIQLATAVYAGADIFYTNDHRLKKFPDIHILTVDG